MSAEEHTEIVWVIGGGSGIGRATALRLARSGRTVVISGRRPAALQQTIDLAHGSGGQITAVTVDVTDATDVVDAHARIVHDFGEVTSLAFGAGTNLSSNRWWESLDSRAFASVVDANLTAAVSVIAAVLPGMRKAGGGRIFVIGSWAGWRYMSVAGAAYGASKSGLAAIVESLNDQEGRAGIRATLVIPGEVNTEILQTRPVPPSPSEVEALLEPDDIARLIENVADLPFRVCVNEIVISGVLNGIYLRDTKYSGPVMVTSDGIR